MRGGSAARHTRACVSQIQAGRGRRAEVARRGLERNVAARGVDGRRCRRAIGRHSACRDGNELRGRRATGGYARAGVADKRVRTARAGRNQISCRGEKRHVSAIRAGATADRGRNTVRVSCTAPRRGGDDGRRRRATGGYARARVSHKNILRRSRDLRAAIGRSQHKDSVTAIRTHQRQRERST